MSPFIQCPEEASPSGQEVDEQSPEAGEGQMGAGEEVRFEHHDHPLELRPSAWVSAQLQT